jgi:prepilin-type N-terminal cleavage/methylation domain-containing protein
MRGETRSQAGFSLIELLIAMVVTVVITGAIFGLILSSNTAFRREPEMSDRQQNIRVAMDLMEQDVTGAGAGMDGFVQAFTPGLWQVGPLGTRGVNTDVLEVRTQRMGCPGFSFCAPLGASTIPSVEAQPVASVPTACFPGALGGTFAWAKGPGGPTPTTQAGVTGFLWVVPGGPLGVCGGVFTAAGGKGYNPNPVCPLVGGQSTCATLVPVEVVQYRIGTDTDGAPALWRTTTGAFIPGGPTFNADGTAGPVLPPGGNWQLVARGIEDLHVEYQTSTQYPNAPNTWPDGPAPLVVNGTFTTIVQRVRVTLSARSMAIGLQGSSFNANVDAAGPAGLRLRGSLTTVMTPRAGPMALANAVPPQWK